MYKNQFLRVRGEAEEEEEEEKLRHRLCIFALRRRAYPGKPTSAKKWLPSGRKAARASSGLASALLRRVSFTLPLRMTNITNNATGGAKPNTAGPLSPLVREGFDLEQRPAFRR